MIRCCRCRRPLDPQPPPEDARRWLCRDYLRDEAEAEAAQYVGDEDAPRGSCARTKP